MLIRANLPGPPLLKQVLSQLLRFRIHYPVLRYSGSLVKIEPVDDFVNLSVLGKEGLVLVGELGLSLNYDRHDASLYWR